MADFFIKAINDTTVEVEFGKEIDKDFIREAERNGKYFAIYKYGDTIRGTVQNSETISFSKDGKSAEFVVNGRIEAGERYYVALIDGPNAKVANVVHTYGPKELLAKAAQPELEVSAVSDKIYVDFNTKMKDSAKDFNNYTVYDNGGKELGKLKDFLAKDTTGEWVNALEKEEVEFTLGENSEKKLLAGKTYKLYVEPTVETDDNQKLNKDDRTITVKTPSVDEAAPKATTARIVENNSTQSIVLTFDEDLGELLNTGNLTNLVEITTATGKKINTTKIQPKIKKDNNELAKNELELVITPADKTEDKLDEGTTYHVDLPASIVNNGIFPNATNKATSKIEASAQANVEIKDMSAKLVANAKNKKHADLLLTFDQRPVLDKDLLVGLAIKDGGDTYKIKEAAQALKNAKYVGDGKSILIEKVNVEDGGFYDGNTLFAPKSDVTYTVEAAAKSVKTDAFNETTSKVSNQDKLKTTTQGVAVTAPVVDRVTLKSATEIEIEFKEEIAGQLDLNKIHVEGFTADRNNFFVQDSLSGSNNFSADVNGKKVTLKAKDDVVFYSGFDKGKFEITFDKDAIVTKGSNVENSEFVIKVNDKDEVEAAGKEIKAVDNAAPVLAFAQSVKVKDQDEIEFVFTENVTFKDDEGKNNAFDGIAALFRTGGDAAHATVGGAAAVKDNSVKVKFVKPWINNDNTTALLDVTVDYKSGQTIYIADSKGNKVENTKLKAVKAVEAFLNNAPLTVPEKLEGAKKELSEAIKQAEELNETLKDNALEEAITKAKEVLNDENASEARQKVAKEDLEAAAAAAELVEAKTTAKTELEAYKTADYTINKEAYDAAVEAGKKAIDDATDKDGVDEALTTAKAAIDKLENDQKVVDNYAATITAPTVSGAVGTVVLPEVEEGYEITVKTTSDENKYDTTGAIVEAGTSEVVYTVKHTASGKSADTSSLTVTVTVTP